MLLYLIKSSLILSLFLGVYLLFLEREKMHRFNRFYLLVTLLLGLFSPFFFFNVFIPSPYIDNGFHSAKKLVQETVVEAPTEFVAKSVGRPILSSSEALSTNKITTRESQLRLLGWGTTSVILIYILGAGFFLVHFVMGLWAMYKQIRSGKKEDLHKATLVLLEGEVIPHSFLEYIFVSKQEYRNGKIPQEILDHELVHIRQLHTLDVFLMELVRVIFWFNPIIHMFNKPIKINHEFLADQAVIASNADAPRYQEVLFDAIRDIKTPPLASTLTYSLAKKRLAMMVKRSSGSIVAVKASITIPIILLLTAFAANEEEYRQRSLLGEEYKVISFNRSLGATSYYSDMTLNSKSSDNLQNILSRVKIYGNDGALYTGAQNWYEKDTNELIGTLVFEKGLLVESSYTDKTWNTKERTVYEYTDMGRNLYTYAENRFGEEKLRQKRQLEGDKWSNTSYYASGEIRWFSEGPIINPGTDSVKTITQSVISYDREGNVVSQRTYN